jgi:hypothetical protein
MVVLVLVAGLLLPRLAEQQLSSIGGSSVGVGAATMVPADGWSKDPQSNDLLLTLTRGAAQFVVIAPSASDVPLENQLDNARIALENDSTKDWQVEEPVSFVTDEGVPGLYLLAQTPSDATMTLVVSDGAISMTAVLDGTDTSWLDVRDDVLTMSKSFSWEGDGQ